MKLEREKKRQEFKKLPKEEQDEIREKLKQKEKEMLEFPYLEDLNDNQYSELQNSNWVCIDPGKRCLLYIKSKNGTKLRYSNKMHMKRTKRLKYQRLIKNYKDKNDITSVENKLSEYNSKTCTYDEFKKFIVNKNKTNEKLFVKYESEVFRKYKWYSYINRKKSETDLVRDIKNKFGKDVIIIHGDWSDKLKKSPCKLKYISTPNVGLKRKLAEYFTIYNIDEFRTSCLDCHSETKCENLYLPDKKGKERKIHSVLTYQTENKRMGCINRDENAVNNMIKIINCFLVDKTRPEKYTRSYVFQKTIKDDNPVLTNSVKCHHA